MVQVRWRARNDLGDISGLSSSIAEIGQIHPIAVKPVDGGYELVAGLRRLTACRNLNRDVLAVEVRPESELAELDMQLAENVRRKGFDLLELGLGLARRKELYDKDHPAATRGGPRPGSGRPRKDGQETKGRETPSDSEDGAERFSKLMAGKLGLGETTIKECLRAAALDRTDRERIELMGGCAARNKEVKKCLKEQRQQKKRERLQQAAAERDGAEPNSGDLITLHHMDNRDFFRACTAVKFDVILTDPPYEAGRKSLIHHAKRGDINTDFGAWDELDIGWVALASEVLDKGGHLLAFSPLEAIGDYREACLALGLGWRGAIIWHKTNPGTAHRPTYISSCEAIIWATKPGTTYHFEAFENAGAPEAHNFIEGPICGGKERLEHPTQKPEWIVERLLCRHAHDFSSVLDPFAGVGTTLAVCQRLAMRCTGVERDDGYTRQARLRLSAGRA